jgi:hypothetical protein
MLHKRNQGAPSTQPFAVTGGRSAQPPPILSSTARPSTCPTTWSTSPEAETASTRGAKSTAEIEVGQYNAAKRLNEWRSKRGMRVDECIDRGRGDGDGRDEGHHSGADGGGRTRTALWPRDFKSLASTGFATSAAKNYLTWLASFCLKQVCAAGGPHRD